MKFMLVSPKNRTTYNFRGELLEELVERGWDVVVTGPNKDDIEKIEELGVRFELVPLDKTGLNVFSDLAYFLNLYNLMRREKPDVILSYTIKPVIYGSISAKLAGVNNINSMVTGVGYVFTASSLKARILRVPVNLLYRLGFRCSDTVIFQNPDDLEEFVQSGLVKSGKCHVVNGSGVNMNRFRLSELPPKTTFLMIARIMHSKGVLEYLQAAAKVKLKYPETRFLLLGALEDTHDSLSMEDLEPYVEDGVVEYFGETDNVAEYLEQCSVYVLPSYREGTPRTVLEAMAMGRPIITTDAPGCRETVINGHNGFLIPVQDSDALAKKMVWFIENSDRMSEMGQNSYELCKAKFDVNYVNQMMFGYMRIT